MGVKLKHASGNGTVIGAPAANPSADITLKAPSTTGSAGQVLAVASANHSSTNAELEWVANSAGTGRKILEQFYTPCDGSVIATSAGNITVGGGSLSASVDPTTSYADMDGSSVAYTPPSGTTQVIYEYSFLLGRKDSGSIIHLKFFIDSDEVTDARTTISAQYTHQLVHYKWGINIGGSAVTATGRQASWSSAKTLKAQVIDYNSSNEGILHGTYHWGGTTANQFHRPCIGITAIG